MFAQIIRVAAFAAPCFALYRRNVSSPLSIDIDWNEVLIESKTTATLQSVANPPMLANSSTRANILDSLGLVAADYVRYVPWFPYPRLAVPEIEAPIINDTHCITSWDFTYADQLLLDFLSSTPNVSHIINFSTTPDWMWVLDTPYSYPEDVNIIDWNYNNGTQLRDQTVKELSDYYRRLISWYVDGGFTDECGVYHESGHHLDIEYWEILNESEAEHGIDIPLYNQIYDAVTAAIHEVSPKTQFIGLAMSTRNATRVQDFLNPANHKANTPLDWISYHFYSTPSNASTQSEAAQSFQMADTFIGEVEQIEEIRKQISPLSRTTVDELGTMDPLGSTTIYPDYTIPDEYWVWSGGIYAYIFSKLAVLGIDAVGESQLSGYPGQYPSVSMVDYHTGLPTARLRVLQLIQQSIRLGDKLVQTSSDETQVHAQAFETTGQEKKILLVNKLDQVISIQASSFQGVTMEVVDVSSGGDIWRTETIKGDTIQLSPYAVAILSE
ncbi:hypothetical protein N7478_008892 [Penicillium angulare]|uniref:uncharacterized protein n=1 Tax=Penicillium angulare TaxID=116970 RepID=UPI0025414FF5|nr:uncharacterized protein N7478_008892 [Penicillium angulare]KAJ5273767.1 hypothetical protein N7478_008892 [Penicillium angulare]